MKAGARRHRVRIVGIEWFNWGVGDLKAPLRRLRDKGAEQIVLVANAREGVVAMRAMASFPKKERLPILSHWGISGGDFFQEAGWDVLKEVDLKFLQTFSFIAPPRRKKGERLFRAYRNRFRDVVSPRDIMAPAGVAHAYDLIHLLAKAVRKAGRVDRAAVREAMVRLKAHDGVMRFYKPPFTNDRQDALDARDFILARFAFDGAIEPIR